MSAVAKVQESQLSEIEKVLIQGDLSVLRPEQRLAYYKQVCDSLGLNPLTKPFEYITLNDKLVLYARREATDQLRKIYEVSVQITGREKIGDVYVVTARAKFPSGREDESTGAVALGRLQGDALANACMKAETKAKRRVTLSICGLGMLDETEVDSIPEARGQQSAPKDVTPKPAQLPRASLGDYIIPFGKYFRNKEKLSEIPDEELKNYFDYLTKGVEQNRSEGKSVNQNTVEALEKIEIYFESKAEDLAAEFEDHS